MPVKAGSTLDPEATRARVLDSAARLFYERGVHVVGVGEIAQHAGASKLTIYRYFGSKDGLVEAVMERRSARIHDWLARRLADAPPGRERVLALFDTLAHWYAERDYRGCAVVNTSVETRHGEGPVRELTRRHLTRYRELLSELLADCGVARPVPLARQLLLLIEGSTVVSAIEGDPGAGRDARAAAEALLDAATSR
ncbi:TetR/AcrR family transcriptional regulator [Streptomyces sp. HNM0575]|uniref:TetR/AcrR family transcriptional regulator n=1 Tax=Streptomyces sp. HNM0575 TaxID=2716338 RepID=UPI00145DD227|nr:TetR/AcrR family transcriptional regulator [Streptomyces sp. HNM0575]NLU76226.1 TetR/AcrR family transcriptional regulator [Streptomyces sp. HNM0575]